MNLIPLGEVSEIKSGFAFKSEDYSNVGTRLVRIGNLNGTGLYFNGDSICVSEKIAEEAKEFLLNDNDVLIAMSGATTGKVALVKKEDLPCLLNQRVGRFTVKKDKLDPKYLYYFLTDDKVKERILKVSGGSAQPNVSPSQLKNFKIPLPDLKTQLEIAQVLEQADKARQQRKTANALTDQFLQSSFLSLFGDPVKNEKGWDVKKVGEVIQSIRYGTGSPPEYSDSGIPFIRATNIKNGRIEKPGMVYISDDEATKIEKCRVKKGDWLIVRSGANTGDAAVVTEEYENALAGYDLIVELKFESAIFYNQLINSDYGVKILEPLTRRAGQPHLNSDQIKNLEFYFPPLSLQRQFAGIVAQAEALRKKQKENEIELENLFQSLLQKYFG